MTDVMKELSDHRTLMFRCPGCGRLHDVRHGPGAQPRWAWNGNLEKPTLAPSIRVTGYREPTPSEAELLPGGYDSIPFICHMYITDGKIEFLHDCTHRLVGQTVDMLPWEDLNGCS